MSARLLISRAALRRGALPAAWTALSGRYTRLARDRTGRDTVRVVAAPGAGEGNLGFWRPATDQIGVEGTILPASPDLLDVTDSDHLDALAAQRGVLLHEVGHANHSDWFEHADDVDALTGQCATILEEIRMEARVADESPDDAAWVRCAARRLTVADVTAVPLAGGMAVARIATWTEGRVAAGTLRVDDLDTIPDMVEDALGATVHDALRGIWARTCDLADGDHKGLLACAADMAALFSDGTSFAFDLEDLLAAIDQAARDAAADLTERQRRDMHASVEEAARAAEHDSGLPHKQPEPDDDDTDDGDHPDESPGHGAGVRGAGVRVSDRRAPTEQERKARRRLSYLLRRARERDRVKRRVRHKLPPGRLLSRAAVQRDAQIALGVTPTALPFRRTVRDWVEAPRMRAAVLGDASGSMSGAIGAVCSAVWVIAGALVDNDGHVLGVAFGNDAKVLHEPGTPVRDVHHCPADGSGEMIAQACAVTESRLRMLSDPAGPRLIVIVSDGHWVWRDQCQGADDYLRRFVASGGVVLLVDKDDEPQEHPCSSLLTFEDDDELPELIGQAVLGALRQRRRR